ncbi:MAG TPA: hypothetical protein VE621_07295, partial [Bryobacteraceae bacterium]|nr:hypothetical protein [Bryobacteraceae bacterium]
LNWSAAIGAGLLAATNLLPGAGRLLGLVPIGAGGALLSVGSALGSFVINEMMKPPAQTARPQANSRVEPE